VQKFGIITPFSLFECWRIPFGLKNIWPFFQWRVDMAIRDYHPAFAWMGDVLICSRNHEDEHVNHMLQVL
jgi:hypothetical protein